MLGAFLITGGISLKGGVRVAGSKNAALPMMAASLLTDEPVVLEGVPRLADVETLGRVLGELGVEAGWGECMSAPGGAAQAEAGAVRAGGREDPRVEQPRELRECSLSAPPYALQVMDSTPVRARYELVRLMRASFCVLGPLLARRGRAIVSLPGGCRIGPRPVDLHLKGLASLGADLTLADRKSVV